jgi:hypothetical protein
VATFKHLGIIMANQNDIHDETESRLNSGNASLCSIMNIYNNIQHFFPYFHTVITTHFQKKNCQQDFSFSSKESMIHFAFMQPKTHYYSYIKGTRFTKHTFHLFISEDGTEVNDLL